MLLPALLLSIAAIALLWNRHTAEETAKTDAALTSAHASMGKTSSVDQRQSSPDFVTHLPAVPKTAKLLDELQQSAKVRGARLTDLTTTPVEATAQLLGRVTCSITLRGSYAAIKSVLADLTARNGNLVVLRLALQRTSAPSDLEAKVELLLLGRPLSVASGAALTSPTPEPSSSAASMPRSPKR